MTNEESPPLITHLIVTEPAQIANRSTTVIPDTSSTLAVGEPFSVRLDEQSEKQNANRISTGTGSHAFAEGTCPGVDEKIETPEFPHLPGAPSFTRSERYQLFELKVGENKPKSQAGKDLIPEGHIYLFNVIVALEWQPSARTIDTLMRAFRSTSDVLYDATNGGMAFGQVVFTGPAYLDRADVQILASNRFHPRSMVNGLTDPKKYSPIRLGRGIWRKDRQILLSWDEETGYRAIAHEWAHYALGLRDEYIDDTIHVRKEGNQLLEDSAWGNAIVIPRVLISLQTLMETLEADELVPLQNNLAQKHVQPNIRALQDRVMNNIDKRYKGLKKKLLANDPGPHRFPLALPRFFHMPDIRITPVGEERLCNVDGVTLDHCWLYSYQKDQPANMISQGRLDERSTQRQAFEVLGPQAYNQLLAIGIKMPARQPGMPRPLGTPALQYAGIAGTDWSQPDEPAWTPVIAVMPVKTGLAWPDMKVQVQVTHDDMPKDVKVWLISPGASLPELHKLSAYPHLYGSQEYGAQPITHMDGIIALQRDGNPDPSWIAEFSYGGNPPSSVKSPGAPINAGSADGNLMIFSALEDELADDIAKRMPFYNKPIVTTRNYAGFEGAGFQGGKKGQPAGYLFSVAASEAIDSVKQKPTIVMYYDGDALARDFDLVIHRYDTLSKVWQPLATYQPSGGSYVATPINTATAPSLVDPDPLRTSRVEYYRLFSVPR